MTLRSDQVELFQLTGACPPPAGPIHVDSSAGIPALPTLPDWSGDRPTVEPEHVADYLVRLGYHVLPWPCRPDHVWSKGRMKGKPARMSWRRATTSPEQIKRWRRRWWAQGYSVAIILEGSGTFVLDADSERAERLAGGLAFGRETFTVDTKRGRHRYYLRAGSIRPDDRRNYASWLAPKLDVVCGLVKAYGPGKRWLSWPDEIAAPPRSLEQAIDETIGEHYTRQERHDAEQAERRETAALAVADPLPVDQLDLRRKYAARALERERQRVASTTDGNRGNVIFKAACALFELVAAPESGLAEGDVWRDLELAAEANGYTASDGIEATRDHIRGGRAKGMQNPRDLSGIGADAGRERRTERAPAVVADQIQAFAGAMIAGKWDDTLAELIDPETGKRVHPMRRETLRLVGLEILRRMYEGRQARLCLGYVEIAEATGRGVASVARAVDLINVTGVLEVERGGIDQNGNPKATLWQLKVESGRVGKRFEEHTLRSATPLFELAVSSDPLMRGLRARGRKPRNEPPDPNAPPLLGASAHRTRAALERAAPHGLTYADLADVAGVSERTARSHVKAYADAGTVELDRERRKGSAGRSRIVAIWVGPVSEAARKAIDTGLRIIAKLHETAARWRDQLAQAKRMVTEGEAPNVAAALRMIRQEADNRRRAELAAASGKERGRPSSADPEPFRRAVRECGGKVREGVELGLTASEAAEFVRTGTLRPADEPLPACWA